MKHLLLIGFGLISTALSAFAEKPINTAVIIAYDHPLSKRDGQRADDFNFATHMEGALIVSLSDIVVYDPVQHIAKVTKAAAERLRSACKSHRVAVFFADGVPCYAAEVFVLSSSASGLGVNLVHFETKETNHANLAVMLGPAYHEWSRSQDDPRENKLFLEWLAKNCKITAKNEQNKSSKEHERVRGR